MYAGSRYIIRYMASITLYIEKVLRPAVADSKIICPSQFWFYEPFLVRLRSSSSNPQFIPALWESPIAMGATLLVPIILLHSYRHENSVILSGYVGWSGLILYILVVGLIWWKSHVVRNIRIEFSNQVLNSTGPADAQGGT
jgi:branched-subunit amino acid transport protein AzlD